MRFRISLQCHEKGNVLPINYQYELASWIYKILNRGDSEFAGWLHQHGYKNGNQYFKFFTFSHLKIPRNISKIVKDKIYLNPGQISFHISFLPEKASESFIIGLFKDMHVKLSDGVSFAEFTVKQVEKLPESAISGTERFKLLSPMVITEPVKKNNKLFQKYLSPEDERFEYYFIQNLQRKYLARKNDLYNKDTENNTNEDIQTKVFSKKEIKFKLLNRPKKKGITLKSNTAYPIKVIGYLFEFELNAPKEIIETGYYGGFGDMCSQGFGCAEIKGNNE